MSAGVRIYCRAGKYNALSAVNYIVELGNYNVEIKGGWSENYNYNVEEYIVEQENIMHLEGGELEL